MRRLKEKIKFNFFTLTLLLAFNWSNSQCSMLTESQETFTNSISDDVTLNNNIGGSGWVPISFNEGTPDILRFPWNPDEIKFCNALDIDNNEPTCDNRQSYQIESIVDSGIINSPNSSDNKVLGALFGEGITTEIDGFEQGERYLLRFNQANARAYGDVFDCRCNRDIKTKRMGFLGLNSGAWTVLIDDNPDTMQSSNLVVNRAPGRSFQWHEALIVIEGLSSGKHKISIIANDGTITRDPRFEVNYNYMLIDNISLTPENSCEDAVSTGNKTNSSFMPHIEIEEYIISGWVKEEHASTQVPNYTSGIEVGFSGSTMAPVLYTPKGQIIEGWQRIESEPFSIPVNATDINIALVNNNGSQPVYFDDIRIHNADGTMKSFVYDPATQRLMAELDENNYATLYEYDQEGGLVRVKKETERGIYTIQETRSGNFIKEDD